MSNWSRILAWEIVAVHLLTGLLFALSIALVLVYIDADKRWVIGAMSPFIAFLCIGWIWEATVIFRMSTEMRRRGGKNVEGD